MVPEKWIWTELLAFDNTAADYGVAAYLERIGFVPDGISLLLSSPDLVLLHRGLEEEYELYPDNCSRVGHDGNEERSRQRWTNFQLRSLTALLQRDKVAVFPSFFPNYLHDRFHPEWASRHPEVLIVYDTLGVTPGVEPLARLHDGRYFEDIFAERLRQVMLDYGFDGFHGPDGCGPAGVLAHNDISDGMIAQFCEFLGDAAPAELLQPTNHVVERLTARMEWLWTHLRREWIDFNCRRWESFWGKQARMLKSIGRKSMINSPNTKGAFEGIYQHGVDYRRIAELGVDYLLVETVAANLELIFGGAERHFDFAATLLDLRAMAPQMEVIFLFGVKDVVESYDLLRHAPGRLEREFFTVANQYRRCGDGSLCRAADGFMVCLGDGLKPDEWSYLRQQWTVGYGFEPVRAGDFTWIWSDTAIDALLEDYPRHGTWPGFKVIGHLTGNYDIAVQSVARIADLEGVTGPVIVPNADLLTGAELDRLKRYSRGPVLLVGNFAAGEIPSDAEAVSVPIGGDYRLTAMLLHGGTTSCDRLDAVPATFAGTPPPAYFWIDTEYMSIPKEFWDRVAAMMRRVRDGKVAAVKTEGELRLLSMEDAAGKLRVGLVSVRPRYLEPEWTFKQTPECVVKVSGFPYTPVRMDDAGRVGTGYNCTPLHIPPCGIIVLEATPGKADKE